MILKNIKVSNFRNIKYANIDFSDGCNIFYGNNAEGKTNLLEAISLCIGKSFRGAKAASFRPFGSDLETHIELSYINDMQPEKLNKVKYHIKNNKAVVTINDIPLASANDLYGEMKYVVFVPEHLMLVKGSPEYRRIYLDNIVMLQNKSHKQIMRDYRNAVTSRDLVTPFPVGCDIPFQKREMLTVYNDIIARQGINLVYGRVKYFTILRDYIISMYKKISGGEESLQLYYNSTLFGKAYTLDDIDFDNKNELYALYRKSLEGGGALWYPVKNGPHKDDMVFYIDGNKVREYGSQGQVRSLSLALKFAEAEMIRDFNKERPVMLLDEVLSELDQNRRTFVVDQLKESQVFITSCNIGDFEHLENVNVWEVSGGEFVCTSRG